MLSHAVDNTSYDSHNRKCGGSVTSADIAGILIEAKAADILPGIRQFSSEQTDGP